MPMRKYKFILIIITLFSFNTNFLYSQSASELKDKISARNESIKRLEEEIKQYQTDIEALGKEKDSLSNTIKSLDISKKKLQADTRITENKIEAKNLEIKELSLQIGDKDERIEDGKRVISQSLYNISQVNSSSIFESLLSTESLSDIWNNADQLASLQGSMQNRIKELSDLKVDLENNKKKTLQKKSELVALTNDLKNQTKVIAETTKEKNTILSETKNTEANYKKILAQRQAQKEAYEREVQEFESALKIAIDPSSIPSTGSGVLKFPIDKVRITQYFGNTAFSTKNPQIYSSGSHNGVDFAASIGTPIHASLSGIVIGAGNTDVKSCRSYGKWIMIKHANGLSTLYAHLSLIAVTVGQNVATAEIIGYSGNTGISTGPHLHFGVYASEGVNITKNKGSKYCSNVTIPYADLKAYLNPLSYL